MLLRVTALAAALSLMGSASGISGKWKVKFLGNPDEWPKMVSEMTFRFETDRTDLTGMAHMAAWPGDAAITNGEIEGDHISFYVVGKSPWTMRRRGGEASGYPRLTFTGTFSGNELKLHLKWDSVIIYGDVPNRAQEFEMAGGRIPE